MEQATVSAAAPRPGIRRFVPLGILLAGLVAFFALGLGEYVSIEALQRHRAALEYHVAHQPVLASLVFVLVYTAAVASSLPIGVFLSMTAGFLFGIVWGTVLAAVGATLGSICIFLAARSAFRETLQRKAGPWLQKVEHGFRENAASYLLTLRLIPILPFWLVNLLPAFFGVPLRTFAVTTAIGIIPADLIFVSLGNGLGQVLDEGRRPDLGILLKPSILLPLLGLALLSLTPVAYKRWRAGKASSG